MIDLKLKQVKMPIKKWTATKLTEKPPYYEHSPDAIKYGLSYEQKVDILTHWFKEQLVSFLNENPDYVIDATSPEGLSNSLRVEFRDDGENQSTAIERRVCTILNRVLMDEYQVADEEEK